MGVLLKTSNSDEKDWEHCFHSRTYLHKNLKHESHNQSKPGGKRQPTNRNFQPSISAIQLWDESNGKKWSRGVAHRELCRGWTDREILEDTKYLSEPSVGGGNQRKRLQNFKTHPHLNPWIVSPILLKHRGFNPILTILIRMLHTQQFAHCI